MTFRDRVINDNDFCLMAGGAQGAEGGCDLPYDGSKARKAGRFKAPAEIEKWIVQMARENSCRGYTRIRGVLHNLGHEVGRYTVK